MTKRFKRAFLIFLGVNLFLYFYLWRFHSFVPFNKFMYKFNAHHYFADERFQGGSFNLLRALGQYDAQWYLRIADAGYPDNPSNVVMKDKSVMDGLTYAFFPFYPLILAILNLPIHNIELTAFIFSFVMLGVSFFSLYFVITKLYNEQLAYKSVFLLFLFPFTLFFRSYYTEVIFLPLLIWYSYFLIKRKWLAVSLFQGLLVVTRPTGLFLLPLTLYLMASDLIKKKIKPARILIYLPIISGFFALWLIFNYYRTGNIFYWKDVQNAWLPLATLPENFLRNIQLFSSFFSLPLHDVHASRLDILIFIYAGFILYSSRKFLKSELWWLSFLMWSLPILLRDTTAFSRYQSVSFPLFIYLAHTLDRKLFAVLAAVFYALLLFLSLYFVNWYWLG